MSGGQKGAYKLAARFMLWRIDVWRLNWASILPLCDAVGWICQSMVDSCTDQQLFLLQSMANDHSCFGNNVKVHLFFSLKIHPIFIVSSWIYVREETPNLPWRMPVTCLEILTVYWADEVEEWYCVCVCACACQYLACPFYYILFLLNTILYLGEKNSAFFCYLVPRCQRARKNK